jgi:arsenate reductase
MLRVGAEAVADRHFNVLFLCTGNSARSILAEALLNHRGQGRFRGFSAGSFPKGEVNPLSLELLHSLGLPTAGLRSKSWDEFASANAPRMDMVFTVCDQAAGEVCPIWPGTPVTAHWSLPDPAAVEGSHAERIGAFRDTLQRIDTRIKLLVSLSINELDRITIKQRVEEIGRTADTNASLAQ